VYYLVPTYADSRFVDDSEGFILFAEPDMVDHDAARWARLKDADGVHVYDGGRIMFEDGEPSNYLGWTSTREPVCV
jgi:hypothetical protein